MNKIILLLALFSLPIAGCGVKPNSVDAPEGAEEVVFPQQYPHK
jgi:predicted small lipoprotein YifL